MDIPDVNVLIENQHSQPVTGVQQRLGTGIVSGAKGVVAIFLHNPYFSFLRLRKCAGPQDTVVVMDTGPTEYDSFSIYRQPLFGVPLQRSDSKCHLGGIRLIGYPARIQIGMAAVPQKGIRNFHTHTDLSLRIGSSSRHDTAFPQDFNRQAAHICGIHQHLDNRRPDTLRPYLQAVHQNVPFFSEIQGHRTIDSGSGVPSAVGLVRVAGNDLDPVCLPVF